MKNMGIAAAILMTALAVVSSCAAPGPATPAQALNGPGVIDGHVVPSPGGDYNPETGLRNLGNR
jgi:hypothetical protein